jgi:hypothetical protein
MPLEALTQVPNPPVHPPNQPSNHPTFHLLSRFLHIVQAINIPGRIPGHDRDAVQRDGDAPQPALQCDRRQFFPRRR